MYVCECSDLSFSLSLSLTLTLSKKLQQQTGHEYEAQQLARIRFLGKLIGTAVRHRIMIPMNFACNVWSPLVGRSLQTSTSLREIDLDFELSLQELELKIEAPISEDSEEAEATRQEMMEQYENAMLVAKDDGVASKDDSASRALLASLELNFSQSNQRQFLEDVRRARLQRSNAQLDSLLQGLGDVLPVELLPLWTPEELELMICGPIELDVELLKRVTAYGPGVREDDEHVQFFWNMMERMTMEEKGDFLKFASACSRLPSSAGDHLMPFSFLKPESKMDNNPDDYMPKVFTCFFQMHLPRYTSQEVCDAKVAQAVTMCTTMDADVVERNGLQSFDE